MISNIVAHIQILNLAILSHLDKHVLKEHIKVFLELHLCQHAARGVSRILVHVWDQNRVRKVGLDVLAGTSFSVSTSSDFKVERTVDLVL